MNRCAPRPRGLARLEFALGIAAASVVLGLALAALARLQVLGGEARRVSLASEQAAASAVQQAHCEIAPPYPAASAPNLSCP